MQHIKTMHKIVSHVPRNLRIYIIKFVVTITIKPIFTIKFKNDLIDYKQLSGSFKQQTYIDCIQSGL